MGRKNVIIGVMAIFITAIIVFVFPSQIYAFQIQDEYYMQDISNHWAEDDITELVYMGILKGYNKSVKPDEKITRAEFIALLVRALNYEDYLSQGKYSFSDVKPQDWYYKVVAIAKQKGIIKGYGDGKFLPDKYITREEIVLTLVRAMKLESKYVSNSNNFNDIKSNYAYKKELNLAVQSKIINGYSDNTFRPKNNALRAEAAVMIRRMLNVKTSTVDSNQQIENLIENYVREYTRNKNRLDSNIQYNLMNSIGKAKDDNKVKAEIIKLYKEKGIRTQEYITDTDIQITNVTGSTAKAKMIYDVTYLKLYQDGSGRIKEYKGQKDFSLRKINNEWKVYNVEEKLYQDKKINMVWEQVSVKTPDMTGVNPMEGVNVVAPTWFELRDKHNPLGVKSTDPIVYKNWQGNIHMINMADSDYIEWAHKNDYDVWGLFRNEFDTDIANKVLNDEKAREKCIELLVEYTQKYKLDGINVDFENVYYNDRDELSQFVRELAVVMREQGIITSVDVTKIEPTSLTWSMCYDREALGKAVDYVALMAYDQNGSWSKKSGSVAQITWVEKALQGVIEKVPKEKMLLGMPLYTRVWEEKNGQVISTKPISMKTAHNLIRENNAKVVWDKQSGQYLATYTKGDKTYKIWVEDSKSISLKASLVNESGLSGTASWRRGYETQDIWTAINESLK